MTLRELLNGGVTLLKEKGISDAALEAEMLLCHLLNKDRIHLYAYGREPVAEELRRRYFDLLEERAAGRPLQYILGTAEFMGVSLMVDESVLIPRQDTELLAEEAFRALSDPLRFPGRPRVLDLCTGSGALAIAVAKGIPNARVAAADLSAQALELARRNAAAAGVAGSIEFYQGDLFEPLEGKTAYDLILSNPPYIATAVIDTLAVEVRAHEPRMALDGGPDGLSVIRRILGEAPRRLKPGGLLLMEIGYDQAEAVKALALGEGKPFAEGRILRDLGGNHRVLEAWRSR